MSEMNILLYIVLVVNCISGMHATQIHAIPNYVVNFCAGNEAIDARFSPTLYDGYRVNIFKKLPVGTEIKVKLDSIGTVYLEKYKNIPDKAKISSDVDLINNIFSFVMLKELERFVFVVKGKDFPNQPPYVSSIKIDGEENCLNPDLKFFEIPAVSVIRTWPEAPDKFCGRRRIDQETLPLIVSGASTSAGHWPWHAAINKLIRGQSKYICGGTLISKFVVLTAAHCATERGVPVNPETLTVVLGKHSLQATEITNQDREIFKVIVYDDFDRRNLNNDIALLKLRSEAIFNNFVQPACIWIEGIYDQMPSYEITGTVVGWGIDQSDTLSKHLREAVLPIIPDSTCIFYEPVFYTSMLNGKKFCAGNNNGTSACNGDSGGAFMVFVQDDKNSNMPEHRRPGAWYIKGIVSATLTRKDANICDPNAYTVYTDVAKYRTWILNYIK